MSKKSNNEDFIKKANAIHLCRYDYSKVEYKNNSSKVEIICPIHGVFTQSPSSHLQGKGCRKCKYDKMKKTKYDCGINDLVYESHSLAYNIWHKMLERCYDEKYKIKHPTYTDCTVCDEWIYFSNFKKWFDENYIEGYQLDKDILVKGNKMYSPDTCCFVPPKINSIFTHVKNGNKNTGILFRRGIYEVQMSFGNSVPKYIGSFKNKEEAIEFYKKEKKKFVNNIALTYYKNGDITEDVYLAMLKF